MDDKAQQYIKRYERLNDNRANWLSRWQQVGDYVYPIRGDMTAEKSFGDSRHTLIYDDTAKQASDILVAGLFSYLTSPYMPWFKLGTRDSELMNKEDIGFWLQDTEQRMYFMFAMSNFYMAMATLYTDLININHGIMFINEDEDNNKLAFHNLSPRDVVIVENNNHKVDTILRKIKWSARQARQEFGEKCGKAVNEKIQQNKPDDFLEFLHVIKPRKDYNPWKRDKMNMKFESVYISMSDKEIIDEGGYPEFPAVIPRWSTYTNDVYGDCPTISSLNNIKSVNKAMELLLKQAEMQMNPPLNVSPGYKDRIRTMPGGINMASKKGDKIEPIVTVGRIEINDKVIADLREQIRERYFTSTFLMLSQLTQRMTAYEVSTRENEKMMMLGPAIGRITDECLGPLIDRCFSIMERKGYFLPIPQSLQGMQIDVEYISPLARAQKAVQAGGIDRIVAFIAPLVQLYPEIVDNIDADKAVREYAELFGTSKTIMRDLDTIKKMRETREKMQEQDAMRQQMLQATAGIKNIADADKAATGDQSVLQNLMGGML